ncbi:hypothetical protein DACRYDRAFT_20763 [Dacryopinax primogenitus]|uniref:Uncharacterized protein n=1 Tax=Dacryopinax primogenitus (strain DJM 731) TaxID=1858805 RepID=M5GFH4_DACPD|nr:uncharacterized protein DACRYDRAFT_20763 [Dacryopinax primogenitus]EJU04138.1 hypothetical protein DACRYDRAFT_20763 [Dacryopinax primogenitus]
MQRSGIDTATRLYHLPTSCTFLAAVHYAAEYADGKTKYSHENTGDPMPTDYEVTLLKAYAARIIRRHALVMMDNGHEIQAALRPARMVVELKLAPEMRRRRIWWSPLEATQLE